MIKKEFETVMETALHECEINFPENYKDAKKRLFISVRNAEKNAEILKTLPHVIVEDLAILAHIYITNEASAVVNNELADVWEVSTAQVMHDAINNAEKIYPATVQTMQSVMEEIMGRPMPGFDMRLWKVSNTSKVYGAAALFYPGIQDKLAEMIGGDYFVLPSSTHEVLVKAIDGNVEANTLCDMVQMINSAEVAAEERLSDHVYRYYVEEQKLKNEK